MRIALLVAVSGVLALAHGSDWIMVTPQDGVKDDYYALPRSADDGSMRFRMLRIKGGVSVEAWVRDDLTVVDDCPTGAVSCTTWTDDCLEVFFDGDCDRNPNTRGPDETRPTPCNAGGEYAIAANGAAQSDYASSKRSFGTEWGGTAVPWLECGKRVGTHYELWFLWKAVGCPVAPREDEPARFGFTICLHDDDDGGACDKALYYRGNPQAPYADERAFDQVELAPMPRIR